MNFDIRNNETETRFETTVDGHTAFSSYLREDPDRIIFTHTEVPEALSGRGIAGEIVKYALEEARAKQQKVVPACSYVAAYIKRHPEYQDLVAG